MKDNTKVKLFLVEQENSNKRDLIFNGTSKEFKKNLSSDSSSEWDGFEKGDRFRMEFDDGKKSEIKAVRVKKVIKTLGLDDSLQKVEYEIFTV